MLETNLTTTTREAPFADATVPSLKQKESPWLQPSVLAAMISTLAVFYAYLHEYGFATSIHIDPDLIILDLGLILNVAFKILFRLFSVILVANLFFVQYKGKSDRLLYQIIHPYRFLAFGVLGVILLPRWWLMPTAWTYVGLFLLISLGPFVFSPITKWSVKGYKNKVRAYIAGRHNEDNLQNRFYMKRTRIEVNTIIGLFQLGYYVYLLGSCEPIGGDYLVSSRLQSSILVRRYGDVLIFADYCPLEKELTNTFHFVKAGEVVEGVYRSTTIPMISRR